MVVVQAIQCAEPNESEADLEVAILEVQRELFGIDRIYLPVKKKIGKNIPDDIFDCRLTRLRDP